MTIIFTDGFDHYTPGASATYFNPNVDLSDRYTVNTSYLGSTSQLWFYPGQYGGFYLNSGNTVNVANSITYNFPTSMTTVCMGVNHLSASGTGCVIRLSNAAGSYIQLRLVSFLPTIVTSSGSFSASSGFTVVSNWNYYELKVTVTGTTANVQAWLDDTMMFDLTGINWYSSGNQTIEQFTLGKITGDTSAVASQSFDDLYVTDGEQLGPIEIQTIKPESDAVKQWVPSTGTDNFPLVGENTVIGSTSAGRPTMDSYVQSGIRDQTDLYNMQNIQSRYNDYDVLGIVPIIFTNQQVSTDPLQPLLSDGNVVNSSLPSFIPTISTSIGYLIKPQPVVVNPITSSSWLPADINSLQFGYVLNPIPDVPADPYWDDVVLLANFDNATRPTDQSIIYTHDATQKTSSNYGTNSRVMVDTTNAQTGYGKVVRNSSSLSGSWCNITPNGYTSTINDWAFSDEFTIEFWFYPISYVAAGRGIMSVKAAGSTYSASTLQWMISDYNDARGLTLEITIDGTIQTISLGTRASVSLPISTWHFVAITRDSSGYLRWYIDGTMVSKTGPLLGSLPAVGYLRLFNRLDIDGDTTNSYTVGAFDEIRFTKKCRYDTDGTMSIPSAPFPAPPA